MAAICTAPLSVAEDLNCMLCHKHLGLSRYDEAGNFKIFYINENLYQRSPHADVECIDCHEGIDEVPHKNVKAVDCSNQCHIDEPSTNRPYSHKPVADLLKKSAHSPISKKGTPKKHQQDYPKCRDCHEQPLYRALVVTKNSHKGVMEKTMSRCMSCHEEDEFIKKYFFHVASRLQKQTDPLQRIEMCAKCHSNRALMKRHDMREVVETYKETFHYKMVRLGSEKMPICIDCHVSSGINGHLIAAMDDPQSPTHPDNVGETCKQSDCHEKASVKLAGFQTHVTYEFDKYPLQYLILLFFRIVMTTVLYGFLVVVFLELLRRLFPNVILYNTQFNYRIK